MILQRIFRLRYSHDKHFHWDYKITHLNLSLNIPDKRFKYGSIKTSLFMINTQENYVYRTVQNVQFVYQVCIKERKIMCVNVPDRV